MMQIAVVGVIIALAVNAPIILYAVWSWGLLKGYSDDGLGRRMLLLRIEVWLRIVLWSTVGSIIWPLWASALGILSYFLGYSRLAEEDAFT